MSISATSHLRLPIEGIKSPANLEKFRASLHAVAGIEKVEDSGSNMVTIVFDACKTNADAIQNAVQASGYQIARQNGV